MADSAPDPKVEDVLSSVRRLVSQEIPRRPASRTEAAADALVLTSAQRIESKPKLQPAQNRSLEQRIAELEAAVDSGMDEFEPDGSEDQAQHRPDRIVYTRPPKPEETVTATRATLRLSEIALIETGPANEDDGAVAAVSFRHNSGEPEAPMAQDVPTLPPSRAEVKHFADPDEVIDRIEARIGHDENGRTVVSVPPTPAPELKPQPAAAPAEQDEDDFEAALSSAVRDSLEADPSGDDAEDATEEPGDVLELTSENAAVEEWIAGSATIEDKVAEVIKEEAAETVEATPVAPVEPVPEDAADVAETPEVSAEPTLEDTSEGDQAPETPATPDAAETAAEALAALPDEDAMRLLVGRLIREELQGELGERITRNVRKLVRREVMRAFASRDLN